MTCIKGKTLSPTPLNWVMFDYKYLAFPSHKYTQEKHLSPNAKNVKNPHSKEQA